MLSNIFGYMLRVLIMCYLSSRYYDTMCHFDTPYSNWLYLEILFFTCWILSTSLFLLLAYCCKYKAQHREIKNKIDRDVWAEKDVDDYLHYIGLEYRQFCLPTSFCFADYFTWSYYTWHNYQTGEDWFSGALELQILCQVNRIAALASLILGSTLDLGHGSSATFVYGTFVLRILVTLACFVTAAVTWRNFGGDNVAHNQRYAIADLIAASILLG